MQSVLKTLFTFIKQNPHSLHSSHIEIWTVFHFSWSNYMYKFIIRHELKGKLSVISVCTEKWRYFLSKTLLLFPKFALLLVLEVSVSLQQAVVLPNPDLQYHIQTDQGPNRFFRFQTASGQYRWWWLAFRKTSLIMLTC